MRLVVALALLALLALPACGGLLGLSDLEKVDCASCGASAADQGSLDGGLGGALSDGASSDGGGSSSLDGGPRSVPDVDASGVTCASPRTTYCAKVAQLLPTQVMDGNGDEFCNVPGVTYQATKGGLLGPATPPPSVDAVATYRLAWSEVGVHLHVHVDDAHVLPAKPGSDIWEGDAVEVFLAGHAPLTGTFDGTRDPGALQIIVAPAVTDSPARADVFQNSVKRGTLDASLFATRIVPGGYEVEMQVFWATLHGTGASGAAISVGLGLDLTDDPLAGKRQLFSFFDLRAAGSSTTCASPPPALPSCDDRLWCAPTLE